MAYNYVTLFKDKTFKSVTSEDQAAYAIVDKTCMYILFSTDCTEKEFQKGSVECTGDVSIAKMAEMISKLSTNPRNELAKGRIGLIYFKTEKKEVFPKLYLDLEFCDFIRDNFPNPVFHLEGQIRLEGGSNAPVSKLFHKSGTQEQIRCQTLTSPFPVEMVQPIKDCKWILESFYFLIGWKDEGWLGGNLNLSSNQVLQNLFSDGSPPKDFKLVAGNGAEIPFHGLILAAKSPALAALVNPSGAMKEHESKRIHMEAFSEKSLKAFVSYIYSQPVPLKGMDCGTALELFRLGHMYQLPELTKSLSKTMLQKGEEWFSPNCALEMYFSVKNLSEFKDLADHTVDIMIKLGDGIRESERYQELDTKEATDLLWILIKKK